MHSENQVRSLRKLYNKTLWTHVGVAALSVAAAIFLSYSPLFTDDSLIPWLIAGGIGLTLSAAEYAIERALYKKGKKAFGFFLGLLLLLLILLETRLLGGYTYLFYPTVLAFLSTRLLIPVISLLRDLGSLRDEKPCEAVGKIKAGTHRKNTESGRGAYVLFEDELTHEVHLLHMSHISPLHRYRVFYLPHSGLAVGEVIPDDMTFDPFGNPIEREVEDPITEKPAYSEEGYAEKADYTEESYTVKPDYTEEEPAEKPWYQNPEAFSANPPKPEPREDTSMPDPNSPERIRAANFGKASKICKVLTFVLMGVMFLGVITTRSPSMIALFFLMIPMIILSEVFKSKELKIRCTRRTTGFCVDTVRRKSGKHSHRYPIVEFEAGGVTHTVELSVSCSRDAVGDIYTLYYDPLDPDVVRPERRGLFD